MKLPNKVITYNESILRLFPIILSTLKIKDYSVIELYFKINIRDINEFMDALDCLYAINKITFNDLTRELHYVV